MLLANKKRTILTVVGIILSVALYLSSNTINAVILEKQFANYNNFCSQAIFINQSVSTEKVKEIINKYQEVKVSFFYETYYYLVDVADQNLSYVDHYAKVVGVCENFENYSVPSVDTRDSIEQVALAYGRSFSNDDFLLERNVCIINESYAKMLFGEVNPLGKKIKLKQIAEYTIVGILKDTDDIIRSINVMQSNMRGVDSIDNNYFLFYAPYTALNKVFRQEATSLILTFPRVDMQSAYEMINSDFPQNNVNGIYYLGKIKEKTRGSAAEVNRLLFALLLIMMIMSGISLSIILLFSFKERTKEIAIKRAIGAKTEDILCQFLLEALHYGLIGGLFGIIAGVYISIIVCPFLSISIAMMLCCIKPYSIIVSLLSSILIATVFSFIPANIAVRKKVIEALRNE